MNHKVTIRLNGQITNAGTFNTREELDAWVEKHKAKGTFGDLHSYEYTDETESEQQQEFNRQYKASLKKKLTGMNEEAWKEVNTVVELKQILREIVDLIDDT